MHTRHPSVVALLEAEATDQPFVAIRRRARAVVATAFALGWEGPPFELDDLASLRGLTVAMSRDLAPDQDACVMPSRVLVNANKPRVRQRYSVAHEVAHTLFPDYEAELRRAGQLWRREGDNTELEALCQAAASEFIMPRDAFVAAAARSGSTISGVIAISRQFDASPEAAARRLAETTRDDMATVVVRPIDPTTGDWLACAPSDAHAPFAPLAVSLVVPSSTGEPMAGGRRVPPPMKCVAEKAWKRVRLAGCTIMIQKSDAEDWTCVGLPGVWCAEAVTLPLVSTSPGQVICLLTRPQS